jgi:hypothetical protein
VVLSGNGGIENTSIDTVYIGGNFVNESVSPRAFDMSYGRIVINGSQSQIFEVAGLELGATLSGFKTTQNTLGDAGGSAHTNFAIGTLEVAPDTDVIFYNGFANTAGNAFCQEALYVRKLIVGKGSFLTASACHIYYGTLVNNGERCFQPYAERLPSSITPALALRPERLNKSRFISLRSRRRAA